MEAVSHDPPQPLEEPMWLNTLAALQSLLNQHVEVTLMHENAATMLAVLEGELGAPDIWFDEDQDQEIHSYSVGGERAGALYLSEQDLTAAAWDGPTLCLLSGGVGIEILPASPG